MTAGVLYRANRNLLSPHGGATYGGLELYRPPDWTYVYLLPKPGDSFVALGGEFAVAFEALSGLKADGFTLAKGERATVLSWDEETSLATWRIDPPAEESLST